MFKSSVLLLLFFTAISGLGVQGRRSLLVQGVSASLAVLSGGQQSANAILSAKYCASGVGEGCQDLSEGNELIKSLQEKSAANKEANRKEAILAYQMKNYPDYFSSQSPPKFLVMKSDSSGFLLMTAEELEPLKQSGKIELVKSTAFKGQTIDYSRKPILKLVK